MSVHENFIMCKVHNLATQIGILGYVSIGFIGLLNGELGVGYL